MSLRIHGFNTVHMDIVGLEVMLLHSGINAKIPRENLLPPTYREKVVLPNGMSGEGCSNPAPIWYIEGAKSRILVEAGISEENVKECNTAFSKYNDPQFYIKKPEHDINKFLARFNVTPEDIDIVILTHLHLDHFANVSAYKNATFIVQDEEIPLALTPPAYGTFDFYYPEFSHHVLSIIDKIEAINGDMVIEPGIEIWKLGGHTPGLMAVAIETKDGLAVLTSDSCLTYKNFEYKWPMGCFFNLKDVLEGYKRIEKYADIVIPQHDYSFWEKYPNGIVG
ncbi:MAG: N-acyl homoserine lactonase family protein [Atribacterota bacterium]|jgi:glyoxylase-like metal-dependent hydrolase (beta-lactamase superfamily II)|nr:N-acyl homoserine lactonase family protein [Atribacterota bacterium]